MTRRDEPEQLVKIEFDRCIGMSQKAYRLEIDGDEHWLPISLVRESSGLRIGETDEWVVIPEWKAKAMGLDQIAEPVD